MSSALCSSLLLPIHVLFSASHQSSASSRLKPNFVLSSSPPSSPVKGGAGESSSEARGRSAELLASFDEAWVSYLEQFVAWKCADAASLEVQAFMTQTGYLKRCKSMQTIMKQWRLILESKP